MRRVEPPQRNVAPVDLTEPFASGGQGVSCEVHPKDEKSSTVDDPRWRRNCYIPRSDRRRTHEIGTPAFLALGIIVVAAAALPAQTVREKFGVEVITMRLLASMLGGAAT